MLQNKIAYIALVVTLVGCSGYSEGSRVGVVNKFSFKGLLCKTWEGRLQISPVEAFAFTVKDERLIPLVQAAMDDQAEVRIKYDQALVVWPCAQESGYVVVGVETLKEN